MAFDQKLSQVARNESFVRCVQDWVVSGVAKANSGAEEGTAWLTRRWFWRALTGQRSSERAVIMMEAPFSRVVLVQGM